MQKIILSLTKEVIFWMAWIIIPVLWEITPAIYGFFILIKKKYINKKYKVPIKYPEVTLIVPVYNSETTLEACLSSIYNSEYPHDMINLYVVDNGSKDNSYDVFIKCQEMYKDMPIWWMSSGQGKSKALNKALFSSKGKYIIHVDSDGTIEKTALKRMIKKFEQNTSVQCMTGSIIINPELVEKTENYFLRMTRKCEMFEYYNAFLAGRNYQSEIGSLYTLSGAFSAYRKSAILKTFLYNSITVSEDTHLTFQMRERLNHDVVICEDALFFVEPIDDYDKLYTQRQRWQRGEIEVSHMFLKDKLRVINFFGNFMVRVLMYDHTFAFPRAIWYFAIFYLVFKNYPIALLIGSTIILYFLYVLAAFMFYLSILMYLSDFKELKKYYAKQWYICIIYPLFNFIVFFMRLAGIVNSITTDITWRTKTLTEEYNSFKIQIKSDFSKIVKFLNKLRKRINHE